MSYLRAISQDDITPPENEYTEDEEIDLSDLADSKRKQLIEE